MRKYYSIRRKVSFIRNTPLHPQWFTFRQEKRNLKILGDAIRGSVLDIGCSEQRVRKYLHRNCTYIGLDYLITATDWYKSRPQVYGDAHSLPFGEKCVDNVLLLDVLEHLPEPERCIAEISRVLRSEGTLILHTPFIYPIHDEPLDFQRWTVHGLYKLLHTYGFEVAETIALGRPVETAALLSNIASSKMFLEFIARKSPFAVFVLFLPFKVLLTNLLACVFSLISPDDDMMPYGYRLTCIKKP